MDGFSAIAAIGWILFWSIGWVSTDAVIIATTLPAPPAVVPTHITETCANRAAQTGTVSFYRERDGYGFIKPDKGGDFLFVHFNDLQSSAIEKLLAGQPVGYSLATHGGKDRAVDVCL